MLHAPRIPELAQRDRFVRRAVKENRVLTLADEESASVASQKYPGRTVQLFWSSPVEGRRWAEALTGDSALQDIPLDTFAADILPGLAKARGLAGVDWVSDPIEAEIDPADLLLRLKTEAIPAFLKHITGRGEVYLVAGRDGPLLQPASRHSGVAEALRVFDTRADAEYAMKRMGGKKIMADPIADFLQSTLPWAVDKGFGVQIEPIANAGPLDAKPADLIARLAALAAAA